MKFAQDVVVLIVGIGMMTWPHEATAKNNKAITLTPIGAAAPALAARAPRLPPMIRRQREYSPSTWHCCRSTCSISAIRLRPYWSLRFR